MLSLDRTKGLICAQVARDQFNNLRGCLGPARIVQFRIIWTAIPVALDKRLQFSHERLRLLPLLQQGKRFHGKMTLHDIAKV